MDIRWIKDLEEFQAQAEVWDRAMLKADNPFVLSDFIISWCRHFRERLQLRILAAYENGRLVMGLPLHLQQGGLRQGYAKILRHVGGSAANYTEMYTEPVFLGQTGKNRWLVLREALNVLPDWDVLHLSDVRPEDPPARGGGHNGTVTQFQDHQNWAIDLQAGEDAYLATRPAKFRKKLRNKTRHAEQTYGPLRLRAISGVEEIERYFDFYTEFSRRGYAKRNRESAFLDARYAGFFRELLVRMARKERLDALVLFGGETVLAINFGFRSSQQGCKRFNWILTAFNSECEYVCPGHLFIKALIHEIVQRGGDRINCYGYESLYKRQWCNEQTPLYQLFMINPTWRGRSFRMLHALERTVRAQPASLRVVRRVREVFR